MDDLKAKIRDIPDFPSPGIIFKDITPLLADGPAFRRAVDALADHYRNQQIDLVVGVEARGFLMSATLAYALGAGNVLVRKPGKLPYKTHQTLYSLEYGQGALEIHEDAIRAGQRILIADDVLATGGTVSATVDLVEKLQGTVVGCAFLIELTFLKGREKLREYPILSLIRY